MQINDYAKLIRHLEEMMNEYDLSREEHRSLLDEIIQIIENN